METSTHLNPSERMDIQGPADVQVKKDNSLLSKTTTTASIDDKTGNTTLEQQTGQLKVGPYFHQDTNLKQSDTAGGLFTTKPQATETHFFDKEAFPRNEDNDLSHKGQQTTWESLQDKSSQWFTQAKQSISDATTQLKESPKLQEAQNKIKSTANQLLKRRKSSEEGESIPARKQQHINPDQMVLSDMKWNDLLPYLVPLLLLTLGLISMIGMYKAIFPSPLASDGTLKPVLTGDADFQDNPMQQTPFHLHDNDAALLHETHNLNQHQQHSTVEEPSLLQKAKFKANLYGHHVKDWAQDSVDSLKDLYGHATHSALNVWDYSVEKTKLLGEHVTDQAELFTDKAKHALWLNKDKEALEADSAYKKLLKQAEEARELAENKAKEAFDYLKDGAINLKEKVTNVPPHEHDLPKNEYISKQQNVHIHQHPPHHVPNEGKHHLHGMP